MSGLIPLCLGTLASFCLLSKPHIFFFFLMCSLIPSYERVNSLGENPHSESLLLRTSATLVKVTLAVNGVFHSSDRLV